MDHHNNRVENTFDITRIEQLAFPGSMDVYQDIEYFDVTETEVYKEAHFCLVPPYCMIEDRDKYIHAAN